MKIPAKTLKWLKVVSSLTASLPCGRPALPSDFVALKGWAGCGCGRRKPRDDIGCAAALIYKSKRDYNRANTGLDSSNIRFKAGSLIYAVNPHAGIFRRTCAFEVIVVNRGILKLRIAAGILSGTALPGGTGSRALQLRN